MDSTQPGRRAPLQMAFVITLTMDGPYIDGAAVLGHSIRTAHSRFATVSYTHLTLPTILLV